MHRSRKYVSVFNEEYVLDLWETFSHDCVVLISFHFLLQGSDFHRPFGLVFDSRNLIVSGANLWCPWHSKFVTRIVKTKVLNAVFFIRPIGRIICSLSGILFFNTPRNLMETNIEFSERQKSKLNKNETFFSCALCVLKRAVRFLPHEVISFRRKKIKFVRNTKFHKGGSYKLGRTPFGHKKISKVKHYFGGF